MPAGVHDSSNLFAGGFSAQPIHQQIVLKDVFPEGT